MRNSVTASPSRVARSVALDVEQGVEEREPAGVGGVQLAAAVRRNDGGHRRCHAAAGAGGAHALGGRGLATSPCGEGVVDGALGGDGVDEPADGAIVEVQHGLHTVSEMPASERTVHRAAALGCLRPRLSGLPRRHRRRAGALPGDAGGRRRVRGDRGTVRHRLRPAGAVDRRRQPRRRCRARTLRPPRPDARRARGDDGGQRRRRRSPSGFRPRRRRPSPSRRRRRAVLPGRVASGAGRVGSGPPRVRHGPLRRGVLRRADDRRRARGHRRGEQLAHRLLVRCRTRRGRVRGDVGGAPRSAHGSAGVAALPGQGGRRSAHRDRRRRGRLPVRGDPVPHDVRRRRVGPAGRAGRRAAGRRTGPLDPRQGAVRCQQRSARPDRQRPDHRPRRRRSPGSPG